LAVPSALSLEVDDMLLGGHVYINTEDPDEYASFLAGKGYKAGYFPPPPQWKYDSKMTVELALVRKAFKKRNLVISEVGAWRNPFDPDPAEAKMSIEYITDRLAIADEVGARCAVCCIGSIVPGNISAFHISDEFYHQAIDVYRKIIDSVKPKVTKMSFELLPFNFLDNAETYVQFATDLDRKSYVGIHLDPVNLIVSPRLYYSCGQVFEKAIKRLAPLGVVSMHLKDLILHPSLPNTFLEEVPLGTGGMDIKAMLFSIDKYLPKDTPLMLEHLNNNFQYDNAAAYTRKVAAEAGIIL
jgi:sugar phosphate isomerase/epimerase